MLSFTLAELLESKSAEFTEIATLFDNLIAELQLQMKVIDEKYAEDRRKLLQVMNAVNNSEDMISSEEKDGEMRELEREREKEVDEILGGVKDQQSERIRSGLAMIWIMYMRVARRIMGIATARAIFKKARQAGASWHVFVASGKNYLFLFVLFICIL